MELNEKYEIKSENIGTLYRQMSNQELIYDPFYQRKFVWEKSHQIEFIRTILLGLPCPEIFIADGKIDLDNHIHYTHVIDGQQRLRTIEKYLSNNLEVDNQYYKDLNVAEKTAVTSYQIGVVKLKYNPEQDQKEIAEIFSRLNIGRYELTETEKTISTFSDNQLVLLARLIANDIVLDNNQFVDDSEDISDDVNFEKKQIVDNIRNNPYIDEQFKMWAFEKDFSMFKTFFLSRDIYSINELKRNNNSKDAIDMIGIFLNGKFHSRTLNEDMIISLSEDIPSKRSRIYNAFNSAIKIFQDIVIPEIDGFKKKKYLLTRSNAFSLLTALLLNSDSLQEMDVNKFNKDLKSFCNNLPSEFIEAARNSNMDKKQREIRHKHLNQIILNSL